MTHWTIEPLPLHSFVAPGPEVLFQRGFGEMIDMVIYAFVLRREGVTVLVDTGLPADYTALNAAIRSRKGPRAGFHQSGSRLVERAIAPHAIVLTSFGPYAVGGLAEFPRVPVHASARGLADLAMPEEPALLHPIPAAARHVLAEAVPFNGESAPFPGLKLIETGVHHPASAAIVVETEAGRVAIADPVFIRRNVIDGTALGAAEHAAGWHGMMRRLASCADSIIPIHDPDPTPLRRDLWHSSFEAV
ncbi:MBL fold metallo-hydrolase [Devosia rhizoryzae]|uniref:MBL fold metallo-hydrolase n=1 Tax=Devosia rhizoryzae TaxID=2774137 RepID=A0ABX7C2J4_9HYPH|nr:hypothetical protein [Devosia rhizoryzae]QQR38423.1 hypothetical protein JI748_11605 [Devosia rhizoryzae]